MEIWEGDFYCPMCGGMECSWSLKGRIYTSNVYPYIDIENWFQGRI